MIKTLLLVVVVSVVCSIAIHFVQEQLFGESNIAITGGVVGGISAALVMSMRKEKK